jgi:aryl-alcohol dehydrogenase-like predicted oxidoreductase
LKFILGTASFDSNYGITNIDRHASEADYLEILTRAKALNIEELDTAPSYGNAESLIGNFHIGNKPFNVYSKISFLSSLSTKNVINDIQKSLDLMKIEKFSGLLFHKSEFLEIESEQATNNLIDGILSSGLTARVGVSVYQESEIEKISRKFPDIKLFQVPENVMDRRLLSSRVINRLIEQGVEFQVRSVFLQGLLLADEKKLSDWFKLSIIGLKELKNYCENHEINIIDLCLNYVSQIDWASNVVIGVNSVEQLSEIVNFRKRDIDFGGLPRPFPELILDPRCWVIN